MAFGEDFIDGVNVPLAAAGRLTRPERRCELWTWHGLPSYPPAGHAPGLAGKVIEGGLEGLEPAGDAFGIDQAIGRRGRNGYRLRCWLQSIVGEEMNARRILRVFYPVRI